jgi:citronellol/citronellal dehydrogenase
MTDRLKGKVAIITGSSRGLGRYCAEGYAREGASVVIAARTETETNPRLPGTIHDTARLVEEAGGEAFPVVCNVTDYASVQSMIEQVLARFGRIDVLMTNAAVQPPGMISTIEIRHWDLEFRVNIHGSFYAIRAALPSMLERGAGNIITISSVAAFGGSHYGATKRAIESMTIGLAREVSDKGVAVNCLRPVGAIETPGVLMDRDSRQPGDRATAAEWPKPDSYVEAAILLAQQTPTSCTGAVLNDAEAIQRLGGPEAFERYRAMNPRNWSASAST